MCAQWPRCESQKWMLAALSERSHSYKANICELSVIRPGNSRERFRQIVPADDAQVSRISHGD